MKLAFEKIIERFEEEIKWSSTHGKDVKFREGRLSGLRTGMRMVNQVAEEYGDGWITIENGLPKESGLVNVTLFNKEIMEKPSCITMLFLAERKHFIHNGTEWSRWVTAWQPLPAPYKGE